MPSIFALLAQQSDPLSGGAGWVGAGLLGLVLSWLLLKHLPSKDAQITLLVCNHTADLKAAAAEKEDALNAREERCIKEAENTRKDFKESLERIEVAHQKQIASMNALFHKDMDTLGKLMSALDTSISKLIPPRVL